MEAPPSTTLPMLAYPFPALPPILQEAPVRMPGLNAPMVYLGAWRTFFALHTEDAELQGLSFLHGGAPKQWCDTQIHIHPSAENTRSCRASRSCTAARPSSAE